MYIERPGSPSATIVAPASRRRSTSMETSRSRLASERPPKKGVAHKNAFRSGELTAIGPIYPRPRQRQVRKPAFAQARLPIYCDGSAEATGACMRYASVLGAALVATSALLFLPAQAQHFFLVTPE